MIDLGLTASGQKIKALGVLSLALGMAACTTPKPPPATAKVPPALVTAINTCATLVPLRSTSTAMGIVEQDRWIQRHYPGAVKINQSIVQCEKKAVDVITFRQNGVDRTVLFDISNFFGRVGTDNLDDLLDG